MNESDMFGDIVVPDKPKPNPKDTIPRLKAIIARTGNPVAKQLLDLCNSGSILTDTSLNMIREWEKG